MNQLFLWVRSDHFLPLVQFVRWNRLLPWDRSDRCNLLRLLLLWGLMNRQNRKRLWGRCHPQCLKILWVR